MKRFLRNHTARSNNFSMTSMGKGYMGKFGIKGVQQEFWKLYYESVKNGENYSLIEMQKNNDFRTSTSISILSTIQMALLQNMKIT